MKKLKRVLSILLCLILAISVFTGCKKLGDTTEPSETDPETQAETETSEAMGNDGDPTYGLFEDGYGWTERTAASPEISFFINEGGNLTSITDGVTKRIATRVVEINGITSKALVVTTSDGTLNALTYDGELIEEIDRGVQSGAALHASELTVYYGKGEDPIEVYAYNLANGTELKVFTDAKIYTGSGTEDNETLVYAFEIQCTYNKYDERLNVCLGYPFGSEFAYERNLEVQEGKVTYDDQDHVDSEGNPPERDEINILYSDKDITYREDSRAINGYVSSAALYAVSSSSSKSRILEQPIDSYTVANNRLYYVSNNNLYMTNIGETKWAMIKEGTQISELFSWKNNLYGLVNTDGEYCIYELDKDGKYVETVWETTAAGASTDSWVASTADVAGRYVVVRTDDTYSENETEIIAVFDMETKGKIIV